MKKLKIGVIGAGQMGGGIAQTATMNGCDVFLYDLEQTILDSSIVAIKKSLQKFVSKNKSPNEFYESSLKAIRLTTNMDDLKNDCDFIIEAVTEDIHIKSKIFQALSQGMNPNTIICTNTSSLPITKLANNINNKEKFIGMHFMNPVPLMKLVEVIPALQTSPETLSSTFHLAERLGKQTALSKDYPGFIANRILMPMINEAIFVLYENIADAETIDKTMQLGTNQPMGPLTLADFIGLDTVLYILEVLYEGFKDPKFRPCPLLVQMVNAGYCGKKKGKGFYDYLK